MSRSLNAANRYTVHEDGEDLPPMVTNYNVPANPNRYGNDPLAEYRVRTNPGNWRHATMNREARWIDNDDDTGTTCSKIFGTNAFRNFLVLLMYSLILIFIYSIRMIAKDTKNWENSRVLGYSQSDLCLNSNYRYLVMSNFTVITEDESIDVGIDSVFMDFEGDKYVCFVGPDKLRKILNDTLITSANLYERFPNNEERAYFPYEDMIVTLCCIGIVFCVVFDESRIRGNGRNRHQVIENKLVVKRINFAIGVVVFIVLLFSMQGFVTMKSEACFWDTETDHDGSLDYDHYCDNLIRYGIEVRSIINPTEFIIRLYRGLNFTLSILLLCACIYRSNAPSGENVNAVHDENTILSRIRDRNRHNATDVNHIEGLISFLYRNGQNQEEGRRASATEPEIALPSLEKWKFSQVSPDKGQQECPICLGDFAMPPTPRPSVGASTHEEVHDGDFGNYIEPDPFNTIEGDNRTQGGGGIDGDLDARIGEGDGVGGAVFVKPTEKGQDRKKKSRDDNGADDTSNSIAQLPCGHVFHRICILNWTIETGTRSNVNQRGASCPVCRVDLMA